MKNISFSWLPALIACLGSLPAAAQDTSPYWSLAGNSNASATTSKLGTSNAIPLRLFTNNAVRMYIHPTSGNVGVGTTTPLTKLHINGFGSFGSHITAANATRALNVADVNAVVRVLRVHAINAPAVELISRTSADGPNVAYWDFFAEPTDKSFRIRDRVGGGTGLTRLTVSSSGHVGIGTTAPASQLTVNTSSGNPFQAQVNGSPKLLVGSNGGVSIGSSLLADNNGLYVEGNTGIGVPWPFNSSKLSINSSAGSSPFEAQIDEVQKFKINANGGVSIGSNTVGPANGLYVGSQAGIGTTNFSYEPLTSFRLAVEDDKDLGGTSGGILSKNRNGSAIRGVGDFFLSPGGGGGSYGVHGSGFDGVFGEGDWDYLGCSGVRGFGSIGVHGSGRYYGVEGWGEEYAGVFGFSYLGYAGYFQGNVYATGTYQGSDRKLKQNIIELTSALEIIKKLEPKEFEYKQDGYYSSMNLPKGRRYGLIAQDVEKILPDLVRVAKFDFRHAQPPAKQKQDAAQVIRINAQISETIDFKTLNYTELIPIMVKGMQELTNENSELKQQVNELQQQMDDLRQLINKQAKNENPKQSRNEQTNVFLSGTHLGGVTPNPVKGTASIQYSISEGSKRAQLMITDDLGRHIKTIQLSTSGVINVDVTSLANGVYQYSLIVDNKIEATRKMTVAK